MAVFLGGDEKMCPIGLEAVVVSLIVYIAKVWETKVGAFYDNLRKLVATAAGYPQLDEGAQTDMPIRFMLNTELKSASALYEDSQSDF